MKNRIWLAATLACLLSLSARAADPDPFMAPTDSAATSPSKTPPSDNPAPSLGTETPATVAKPNPEAQTPLPLNSIPGKTETSPYKNPDTANKKDIYDEYDDYLHSEKDRQTTNNDQDMRNFFPHEDGAWQLGLLYSLTAFNGYNFNFKPDLGTVNRDSPLYGKTQGGTILVNWFPIRSLTVGRLGFGVNAGIFWTKFDVPTQSFDSNGGSSNVTTTSKPQNILTYGARATYELDYWLAQILVPYAAVGFDEVAVQAFSVSAGNLTYVRIPRRQLVSSYWLAGAHFYLNRVEPVVGSRGLVNVGIRKFYLSYSYLQRTGDLAGGTHSIGLTFEF
jgi:hypothetical protein